MEKFTCRKCDNNFPTWFESAGKTICNCCEAIRRYPNGNRPPIEEFRARLLLVAESKHFRRTAGVNKCQSCGSIHSFNKTRSTRWQHLCETCERLHIRIYRQTHKAKKRDAIGQSMRKALKAGGKSPTVKDALGYTIAALRTHLERQFLPGMAWHNMADWHIDHITPQAAFNLADADQWRVCWGLGNLRPMWGHENIAKGAKQLFLL